MLAVYTAADMTRAGYGLLRCKLPLKSADGSALFVPPRPLLADGRVRYVGEILAVVVATTRHAAQEAAEHIHVEFDPLPVVTDPEAAARDDAPRLHDGHSNVCLDWRFGDARGDRARVCGRGPCHAAEDDQQPGRGGRHGAARGDRGL